MQRWAWLLIVGGLCLAVVGSVAVADDQLVVTDSSGTEQLTIPIEEGSTVTIEYTHSVEQTLVRDSYAVDDGAFVMERMEFSSFGAGLPAQADVRVEDGRYVYEPPAQRHTTLRVTTGQIADHDLIVDGQRYDLATIADGETVELRIV